MCAKVGAAKAYGIRTRIAPGEFCGSLSLHQPADRLGSSIYYAIK
jgi:hypothetical protein